MRTCNRCHSFRPYGSVVTVDAIYGNKNEADLEGAALARLVGNLVEGGPATKVRADYIVRSMHFVVKQIIL